MIHSIQPLPAHRPAEVELTYEEDRCQVQPTIEAADALASFPLPPLPLSLVIEMGLMADCLHARYGRCMVQMLLLDCQTHAWSTAIPPQQCFADGVRWTWPRTDGSAATSALCLAGSYQSTPMCEPEEMALHVPPVDGLHLLYEVASPECMVNHFIRSGGVTRAVIADHVQVDDWHCLLDAHRERLVLC